MDVKAAVKLAKEYALDLFADENITNLGLEEVSFYDEDGEWTVTLGFSRPWDEPRNTLASLAQTNLPRRSYKIVRIDDNGKVKGVKNREGKYEMNYEAPF
ncbi:MAG: hypothetical protein CDV28_1607 [Candidatus Electronema aureum]|uniref:PepSY domain-containing protein n=1 Tax=Candidatus Electronema aureum TaxID=2005002 RepID=A0A521FYF2_9BACT|nr:MAG: hypothetical protein CDV28_1607 [Candidatus Electronema aureum]